jgi:hypothetical protein
MTIYYREIILKPSPDNPTRMEFVAAEDAPDAPTEVVALREGFQQAARVARILFPDNADIRKEVFLEMHAAADRGLRGPNFNLFDGQANLRAIRESITDNAQIVRDARLKSYTLCAVLGGVLPGVFGVLLLYTNAFGLFKSTSAQPYDPLFVGLVSLFLIPAGASICVWAEFVLRMQRGLTFDQLLELDPARWNPVQRVSITIGIAAIFAFLLAFDAIQVGVGNLLLNDFAKKMPLLGFAVGGVTGLAFPAVQDIIFRLKPEERK